MNSFLSQKKINTGQSLARLLVEPGVIIALGDMQTKYETAWKHTDPCQVDEREKLWMMLATLETFKQEMLRIVDDGRFEEITREQDSKE